MCSLNQWGSIKNQLITIYETGKGRRHFGDALSHYTLSDLWLFSKKTLSESRKACLCE
jgi:hypothetical protein